MARGKSRTPPPLHELEAQVMDEVWRRGQATVRDVLEALNRRGDKKRAYTTIMTIMMRLDGKGLLQRRREGRSDVYLPVLTRDAYMEARAKGEVDELVAGYGDLALAHFARQLASLDPKRRDQLRKLTEES